MRERLIKFLEHENINPAKFADSIGVQRSSISHILSGRNNPSYEFIQKILNKYKYLNAEWLIMGTGVMIKAIKQGTLFEKNEAETSTIDNKNNEVHINEPVIELQKSNSLNNNILTKNKREIEKIIILNKDKSFTIYFPDE